MLFSRGMNPPITKRFSGKAPQIIHRKALKWLLPTYIRIVNPIVESTAWGNGFKENIKGLLFGSPFIIFYPVVMSCD